MVNRSSGSFQFQTVKQLLRQKAKSTSNVDTKIHILAVKAASYDAKMHLPTTNGIKESRLKADKLQRLQTVLMEYKSMSRQQANKYAQMLFAEAKTAMEENQPDQPFTSSLPSMMAFKEAPNSSQAQAAFFTFVEAHQNVKDVISVLETSRWKEDISFTQELTTTSNQQVQNAQTQTSRSLYAELTRELQAHTTRINSRSIDKQLTTEARNLINRIALPSSGVRGDRAVNVLNQVKQRNDPLLAKYVAIEARNQAAAAMRMGQKNRATLLRALADRVEALNIR